MDNIWASIGAKIWAYLEPKIEAKFNEWLPKIAKTVIVAVSQAAGQLVVNQTDKITEVIPGKVDDYVVDAIVDRTRDALWQVGIRF